MYLLLTFTIALIYYYYYYLTWWAAEMKAGSKAENAVPGCGNGGDVSLSYPDNVTEPGGKDKFRRAGTFMYGTTLHGSSGVLTGGLWLFSIIPGEKQRNSSVGFKFQSKLQEKSCNIRFFIFY